MKDLVLKEGKKLVTTSLVVAEETGREHRFVIRLVRKYQDKLCSVGKVAFQRRLNEQGSATEYAILDEPAVTLLLTLFKNSDKIVEFKTALVKEFYRMREHIKKQEQMRQSTDWKDIRYQTKEVFKLVALVLDETRKLQGKETTGNHYANEARMMNQVLTGKWGAVKRDDLTEEQLKTLKKIQDENSRMLIQGYQYGDRKYALLDKFVPKIEH